MSRLRPQTWMVTRQISTSRFYRASESYPPGPQARHFPIKTDTMLPQGSFKDKVVLVTGGGTGLGKGMSAKFSELGAKVSPAHVITRPVTTSDLPDRLQSAAEDCQCWRRPPRRFPRRPMGSFSPSSWTSETPRLWGKPWTR